MNKSLFMAAAALAVVVACSEKKPVDKLLPSDTIEVTGDGFQNFAAAGDVKLFLAQDPDDAKKWTVRATLPITKTSKAPVSALEAGLDLLDANGARIHDDFGLKAQELEAVLPVLNTEEGSQRNVVFSAETFLDQAAAKKILDGVQSLRLNLACQGGTPAAAPAPQPAAPTFPAVVNVTSLIQFYGIRGILREYESAYRSGSKSRMKQIKGRLEAIDSKVRNHPRGGRSIANSLEDWIDDQIDEIEDRVDDER